ncbi:MAG: hypothetical protein Q4E17_01155 [Synergistes sp.]|nr:hypothetical protein [Synergistes sp.]
MSRKESFLFGRLDQGTKQIIGLFAGIIANVCLMLYKVPKHGAWMPRWSYGVLNFFFGTELEIQSPGILGAFLAILMFIFLCRRGFVDAEFIDNPISILCTLVNIWGFGMVFNIIFGDMKHLLDGGATVTAAVAAYAVATMGMKKYVPLAYLVLAGLCMVNIFSAESALLLSGAAGVILMFMSLILQYKRFVKTLLSMDFGFGGD